MSLSTGGRFSKDIDVVDTNIPQQSQSLITTFAPLISTFIVIIYSFPYFAVVFVPLGIFFTILQVIVVEILSVQRHDCTYFSYCKFVYQRIASSK